MSFPATVRVIGVEAADSACLQAALKANRRVRLAHTGIFADGVSVAQVGKAPFALIRDHVDEVITATTDEICAAIKDLFDDTRSVAEPAGALALAGLKNYVRRRRVKGKTLLTIASGANTNFDRLRFVSERHAVGEQTEMLLGVTIPERPGSLLELCEHAGGYDVTEFNYRYSAGRHDASVFMAVRLREGRKDRDRLIRSLKRHGHPVQDLSANNLAKLHICHMIGGHGSALPEALYRFEFPERPGILEEFLTVMRGRWSLSLFQYRQHGGCYANVLVGFQQIPGTDYRIQDFLDELGYSYVRETDNPAYRMFHHQHGDCFKPFGMNGTQKISRYFSNNKIPVSQRLKSPVLLSGNKIVWVVGHRIDEAFKVTDSTENILKIEVRIED